MSLTAHLHGLQRNNIEDWTVSGEERVQGDPDVCFLDHGGGYIAYVKAR